MTRIDKITFEFVDLLPPTLEDGTIYVSVEHCTVVHNCLSGCGERVVNGLNPAQWTLTFDGETISISPSIGNGALACNTHYWIQKNRVIWSAPLNAHQTRALQIADQQDLTDHYKPQPAGSSIAARGWKTLPQWKQRLRLLKRLFGRPGER